METTNLDIYGHAPLPWSRAEQALEAAIGQDITHFLATVRPDGRPHIAGVGALWVDGKFYFVSGAGTRKSQNLAERRRLRHLGQADRPRSRRRGLGREGDRRADAPASRRALRRAGLAGDRRGRRVAPYSAPSAGPPPWDLYEFTPTIAFGVAGAEPHGATRWNFASLNEARAEARGTLGASDRRGEPDSGIRGRVGDVHRARGDRGRSRVDDHPIVREHRRAAEVRRPFARVLAVSALVLTTNALGACTIVGLARWYRGARRTLVAIDFAVLLASWSVLTLFVFSRTCRSSRGCCPQWPWFWLGVHRWSARTEPVHEHGMIR